ncbi:MAG: coenzyme F420-0:L-glutamate ligase [Deltaproteobacteria bacterium]|jgi:coenzyme F420-0:L-glutamate ligase|nr:coenzyme F420-0:L-glutamate ligase [Deltaproteobacteria bacterium]
MLLLEEIPNFPIVNLGDDLAQIIVSQIVEKRFDLQDGDILCVASKVVSTAENRLVNLDTIVPCELALRLHERVKRKDARVIQLIINETTDQSGSRLELGENWIGAWLPNGQRLTSAGIDKVDSHSVLLLPENTDLSAKKIGQALFNTFNVKVGVIITDSEGQPDKTGAIQVAIGLYGVPPVRITKTINKETGDERVAEESLCDMCAAAVGLIMGQRGTNKPVVRVRGLHFDFDEQATVTEALRYGIGAQKINVHELCAKQK